MKPNSKQLSNIISEIKIVGGGKMIIEPFSSHHYLFLKNKETEPIKLTTKKAQKLADYAKEYERVDMGRVRFWF